MKYAVITFGCRVNQADSLGFEEELHARGLIPAPAESADVVVVNTCSVTASADQGARQTIRRVARANPGARIVVTGCYATRRPDDVAALPNVVRVLPNGQKPAFGEVADGLGLTTADRFGDGDGGCGAAIGPGLAGRTAFTLRAQTGCAESCAYCIIPATRGAPRSRTPDELLREIDRVARAGFKEIALTGVHLGSYGRDLPRASSLLSLLRAIERASGSDLRVRISSLEPMDCGDELVDLVAGSATFAEHFHLPLQHASDRVLKTMRRPYTLDDFARLVDGIRRRMPDASIGTDVIAGFPGETDDDAESLTTYLERSPVTHAHVFPYSDRPGTAATAMDGKVPGGLVRDRARRLREVSNALTSRFRTSQIGTEHRALTIERGEMAVTGNYLKVQMPPGHRRNEWVRVRLAGTGGALSAAVL